MTFVESLHTLGGHGDPTLKEGLAVHTFAFDADMNRQAFANNDGEFLIVPTRGILDIQTELGHLRVPPGSIAVVPPGFRFSVNIASFPQSAGASGYILEAFGTHFKLPEMGPLGANGLAHVRDFRYPVASFDVDFDPLPLTPTDSQAFLRGASPSDWRIITKLAGRFYQYTQPHTPFDVVAWHGRYSPYKYDLSHFNHLTANTDQLDPTAYTVLTAATKWPGVSLVDFCVFGEKYAVARDTLRIPYHHRTMATELVGIIKGKYGGSVRRLEAGGLSFEQGYMPHGESYDCWRRESERDLKVELGGKDFLGFMFHASSHVGLTRWATERHPDIRRECLLILSVHPCLSPSARNLLASLLCKPSLTKTLLLVEEPGIWDNLRAPFADRLNQASQALETMKAANDAAIHAELTALAFEVMASRRRLSVRSVTDDEDEQTHIQAL